MRGQLASGARAQIMSWLVGRRVWPSRKIGLYKELLTACVTKQYYRILHLYHSVCWFFLPANKLTGLGLLHH